MGFDIASKQFEYTTKEIRRQRQMIIRLNDARDVRLLSFTLQSSCRAELWIRANSRDAMSYEGTIEPIRP